MKQQPINKQLTRDPRYVAACARLTELRAELNQLEAQVDGTISKANALPSSHDLVRDEAAQMLSGYTAPVTSKAAVLKTLEDLYHRRAVVREAVDMQKRIVEGLAAEVGKAISAELAPEYREAVRAMIAKAIQLAELAEAESDFRDALYQNGVQFTAHIRPMPINGFHIRDPNSWLSRYLLEAEVHGFIKASELPAILRPHIQTRTQPATYTVPTTRKLNGADWDAE